MRKCRIQEKFRNSCRGSNIPDLYQVKLLLLVRMLIIMILRKNRHIWPVLYNTAREKVKISLHFMLKVVVEDSIGEVLVMVVASEEVAMAEVDVEVMASGGHKRILPSHHKLTSNGRFLAMMKRATYLLSAINLNHARSMRLRYWYRR